MIDVTVELKQLPVTQLTPTKKQDRIDWHSPTAREHINKLKKSISTLMPDGSLYGVRERIVVKPTTDPEIFEIIKGESRWRAAMEISNEMLVDVEVRIYKDKKLEHYDHVTENSLHRSLNIWERASSIKKDKDNGADTETLMAIHGLSNKTVVSKYMGVFKLTRAQQKLTQSSYINDLNMISKLAKLSDIDAKEMLKRCEDGEQPKKVLTELLNRAKPEIKKEPVIKFSFSRSQCNTILELLGLNPDDMDNPDEDIEILLKSRLEELAGDQPDNSQEENND